MTRKPQTLTVDGRLYRVSFNVAGEGAIWRGDDVPRCPDLVQWVPERDPAAIRAVADALRPKYPRIVAVTA